MGWGRAGVAGRNGEWGYGRAGVSGKGEDCSTFFFSNFPERYGEMDMVKVFQKWAAVKEVFISRRPNKWGRRFEFVRFLDVKNVVRLEGDLDRIYIGNRKLHVNIPKYLRNQHVPRREERRTQGWEHNQNQKEDGARAVRDDKGKGKLSLAVRDDKGKGQQNVKGVLKEVWMEKRGNKSYAEIVAGGSHDQWKGPVVKSQQNTPQWMLKSLVGSLREGVDFGKLEEELVKGGMKMVKARFMGDDQVLLTPTEGEVMEDIIKTNEAWFDIFFSSVRSWTHNYGVNNRIIWVRCFGLPIQVWNRDCFTKVIREFAKSATVVAVDEASLSWEVLEYARLKVRVQNGGSVRWARRMQVNDLLCDILVEEEPGGCYGWGCKGRNCWEASSDSVSSSETYVEESAFSDGSGEEHVSNSNGDAWWSVGKDGEGALEGDGEQSMKKSTLPCLETGKADILIGRVRDLSGVSQKVKDKDGRPSDSSTVQISGEGYSSNLSQSKAAKEVIDAELNDNVSFKYMGRIQVFEARLSEQGHNNVAQKEYTGEGHNCLTTNEYEGPGGAKSNEEGRKGVEEEEMESDWHERGEVSSVQLREGIQLEERGVLRAVSAVIQSVDDGNVGVKSPRFQGVDVAMLKSRSISPPRRRKKKGFVELGVSCPQLRRSARLSEKHLRAGWLGQNREVSPSISISDTDIRFCNSRLRIPDSEEESARLWAEGRKVGLLCRGDEKEVVREYGRMEERDSMVLMESKLGDTDIIQ